MHNNSGYMTSKLNSNDINPDDVIRMIVLGPKAEVNENEVVSHVRLLGLPVKVKITCYGAMVSGKEEDILKVIKELRKLDPNNLFTRERGFPLGDPKRCKGPRHGLKEEFHKMESWWDHKCTCGWCILKERFDQMEIEYKLLEHVSDALRNPKEVSIEEKKQMNVDELEKIFKEN